MLNGVLTLRIRGDLVSGLVFALQLLDIEEEFMAGLFEKLAHQCGRDIVLLLEALLVGSIICAVCIKKCK